MQNTFLLSLQILSFFLFAFGWVFFLVNYSKATLRRQRNDKMSFLAVMSRNTVKYAKGCTLNTEDQRAKKFTATLSRK